MNSAIKGVLMFAAGAAIGSFATWKLLNARYEERYQEAVKSTKEAYSRRNPSVDSEEGEETSEDELPDIKVYAALLKQEDYIDYSSNTSPSDAEKEEKKDTTVERPYVISPEEFGEFDDYERISLTYYADGKLTDDNDELVDDVDEIVGEDSLTHFGEYEDDSVFVRNDARKCDYEILLDQRNYFDVIKTNPHRPMED